MKSIASLSLFLLAAISLMAQQYPQAFKWPATPSGDQQVQGPCHIFATVSSVGTWYKMLFGGNAPQISQLHLYSRCGGANPSSSTIVDAMTFFRDKGPVDANCLPYSAASACTSPSPTGTPYFADKIALTPPNPNPVLINNSCETPWCNCGSTQVPIQRYKVADFALLNIAAMTSQDQLKSAILNKGPITLWMHDPSLHGNGNHAYSLYGWDATGKWLVTDSWPGFGGSNSFVLDIISVFQSHPDFVAYYINSTPTHTAMYIQNYSGGVWSDNPATTAANIVCNDSTLINSFQISVPSLITTAGQTATIINIGLLDNPTVTWSSESVAYNASVSFSPATGASTTVTGAVSGTVNIIATIKWANGVCLRIKKNNITVKGSTIPFTFTNTVNNCVGTSRNITYVVSGPYPTSCVFTFHPSPGCQYSTNISGCTFNVVIYSPLPTGYGITVAITSSSFPGINDGATAGGSANSCASGHSLIRDPGSVDVESITPEISISPNPASNILSVHLPVNQNYYVRVINILGSTVYSSNTMKSIDIDISRFRKGIYFVQIFDPVKGHFTIKNILIQ